MAANSNEDVIADEADVEAFNQQPAEQRQLTSRLKGVLAETACTGIMRYKWSSTQPLLVHLMKLQLKDYEAAEHIDVGPARPLLSGDDSVAALFERFASMLQAFQDPPWTLQRLCELLLEPRKQYQRLHKLALAIEKLLLVTGEADVSAAPGPLPRLSQFNRINEAPPGAAAAAGAGTAAVGQKRQRPEDADAGGLVAAALAVKQHSAHAEQQHDQQAPPLSGPSAATADANCSASNAAENTAMEVDNSPSSSDSQTDWVNPAGDRQDAATADRQAPTDEALVAPTDKAVQDQPVKAGTTDSTVNAAAVS